MGLPRLLAPGRHRPDTDRTPVEAIAVERLRPGGLQSENLVDDALTIAIAETGVPVFALDADKVDGELGCGWRAPASSSTSVRPLSRRQLVVADDAARWRSCSARWPTTRACTWDTQRMTLCALRVKGGAPDRGRGSLVDRRRDASPGLHLIRATSASAAGRPADASRRARRPQVAARAGRPPRGGAGAAVLLDLAAQGVHARRRGPRRAAAAVAGRARGAARRPGRLRAARPPGCSRIAPTARSSTGA